MNTVGVLLFNHDTDRVLGKVKRAWVENQRGCAEVQFDTDDDAEVVYQKVQSGTLKGVSVRYTVDAVEEISPGKYSADGHVGPCTIIRQWTPLEVSIVSVPADETVGVGRDMEDDNEQDSGEATAAQVTSQKQSRANKNAGGEQQMNLKEKLQAAITRQQELTTAAKTAKRDLSEDETREFDALQVKIEEYRAAIEAEEKGPSTDEAVRAALAAERQRVKDITNLCRGFGMVPEKYIEENKTIEEVRAAVLADLQKNGAPLQVRVTADEGDKFRAAATDGLLLRTGTGVAQPAEGSREFRGMSLRDIAVECYVREGRSTQEMLRMDKGQLFDTLQRAFFDPTAAFPAILDATIRKSIVEAYNKVPTTFQAWTAKGSVSDFKPTPDHQYLLGGVGEFELVPENGEIKHSRAATHLLPNRQIQTYGKQFSMSRQAFINDDIGFLSAVPGAYSQAAKKTIDKAVYTILFSNPAIFDSKALFHTSHKNLVSGGGAAPSATTIQEIILLAQGQTDPFGEPIYMTPRFLIVPVGYEFVLATIFGSAQVVGSPNNDINPLYNYPLTAVQTPWLNSLAGAGAKPWFMATDPSSAKSIQVDYLNGVETPTFRRSEVSGQLGYVWDIWLDWGITAVDYRGIYKNLGVA